MQLQPGNQLGKGVVNHRRPRVIQQNLIAALNEADENNIPKIRRLVNALFVPKALEGDVAAMKEVMDRVDGKVPQQIQGDPDAPLIIDRIIREFVEPEPHMTHTNGHAGDH